MASIIKAMIVYTNLLQHQVLKFNSLQFQLAETGIYIQSNHNKVRYCYFYDIEWGLRIGQNTDIIHKAAPE